MVIKRELGWEQCKFNEGCMGNFMDLYGCREKNCECNLLVLAKSILIGPEV